MDNTCKIIYHPNIRSALDPDSQNFCMEPLNHAKVLAPIIKSRHDSDPVDSLDHGEENDLVMPMPVVVPNDIVGHTFLMPPQEDGQCFCTHIVRATEDHEWNLAKNEDCIHFLLYQ
jgi:hypothetical protein